MPGSANTMRFKIAVLLFIGALQARAGDAAVPADAITFHKYFAGKIADKYPFTMELRNQNGKLDGHYQYKGKHYWLDLHGNIDSSGAFSISETDPNQHQESTGSLTGKLSGKAIAGIWQSADGTKQWPFAANQTSEVIIGTKREILRRAIGDYVLDEISGSGGANGMWDTWKEDGRWKSTYSGISALMRETNTIKLKQADILLLDSMKIRVEPDLTVRLMASGKPVLTIPFREAGMQRNIENEHPVKRAVAESLQRYTPDTTVLDEHLYLLVQDGVDFSKEIHGSFEADTGGVVTVSYSIVDDSFAVAFDLADSWGGTTFTFKSRRKPAP